MSHALKIYLCLTVLGGLSACGSDTVIHEKPVVVTPAVSAAPMTPDSVESTCAHGYDNSTHRCF